MLIDKKKNRKKLAIVEITERQYKDVDDLAFTANWGRGVTRT